MLRSCAHRRPGLLVDRESNRFKKPTVFVQRPVDFADAKVVGVGRVCPRNSNPLFPGPLVCSTRFTVKMGGLSPYERTTHTHTRIRPPKSCFSWSLQFIFCIRSFFVLSGRTNPLALGRRGRASGFGRVLGEWHRNILMFPMHMSGHRAANEDWKNSTGGWVLRLAKTEPPQPAGAKTRCFAQVPAVRDPGIKPHCRERKYDIFPCVSSRQHQVFLFAAFRHRGAVLLTPVGH